MLFFNVSDEVLARIEGASYISNKEKDNDYLWFHPYVAKKRFINLYSTGSLIRSEPFRINGGVDKRKRRSTKVDDRSYRDATAGRETGPVAARAASPGHVDGYQPES